MADSQNQRDAQEPSMEEILSSIRKIIRDDQPDAEAARPKKQNDNVFDLTEMVRDDGSITRLDPQREPLSLTEVDIVDVEEPSVSSILSRLQSAREGLEDERSVPPFGDRSGQGLGSIGRPGPHSGDGSRGKTIELDEADVFEAADVGALDLEPSQELAQEEPLDLGAAEAAAAEQEAAEDAQREALERQESEPAQTEAPDRQGAEPSQAEALEGQEAEPAAPQTAEATESAADKPEVGAVDTPPGSAAQPARDEAAAPARSEPVEEEERPKKRKGLLAKKRVSEERSATGHREDESPLTAGAPEPDREAAAQPASPGPEDASRPHEKAQSQPSEPPLELHEPVEIPAVATADRGLSEPKDEGPAEPEPTDFDTAAHALGAAAASVSAADRPDRASAAVEGTSPRSMPRPEQSDAYHEDKEQGGESEPAPMPDVHWAAGAAPPGPAPAEPPAEEARERHAPGPQDSSPAPFVVEKTIEEILAEAAAEDAERTLSAMEHATTPQRRPRQGPEPYTLSLNDAGVADAEDTRPGTEEVRAASIAPPRAARATTAAPAPQRPVEEPAPAEEPQAASAKAAKPETASAEAVKPESADAETPSPETGPEGVAVPHAARDAAAGTPTKGPDHPQAPPVVTEGTAAPTSVLPTASAKEELRASLGDDKGAGDTGDDDIGIEQMVREALVPVLKEYLDENLKPIIERIVREETRRILLGRKAK
jgi:cell pole-organizing protein PopZ